MEKEEITVTISLKGQKEIMEFAGFLDVVLKATGSKYVHSCSAIKLQVEDQLRQIQEKEKEKKKKNDNG